MDAFLELCQELGLVGDAAEHVQPGRRYRRGHIRIALDCLLKGLSGSLPRIWNPIAQSSQRPNVSNRLALKTLETEGHRWRGSETD